MYGMALRVSLLLLALLLLAGDLRAAQGGPDAGGYYFIDSTEAGGPVYSFNDLTVSPTATTWTAIFGGAQPGDDEHGWVAINPAPFIFPYYGAALDLGDNVAGGMWISTNGWICFNYNGDGTFDPGVTNPEVGGYFGNVAIPAAAVINNTIYPYWDDLYGPGDGAPTGEIWGDVQGAAPNRTLVIQWNNMCRLADDSPVDFEVIIREGSSDILFQYRSMNGTGTGDSATVGIENGAGAIGTQYSFDTPGSIVNGRAILFTLTAPGGGGGAGAGGNEVTGGGSGGGGCLVRAQDARAALPCGAAAALLCLSLLALCVRRG
ncbi:MAG: hypothetical protein RDV41_02460 [Planctomycetota bacterium]|nr:hypothetical protein [Planctomycetota bacterium]